MEIFHGTMSIKQVFQYFSDEIIVDFFMMLVGLHRFDVSHKLTDFLRKSFTESFWDNGKFLLFVEFDFFFLAGELWGLLI